MKEIQPQFAEAVAFVAIDIGYSDLKELHAFAQEQGYPWATGLGDQELLQAFRVKVQSTKIAIDMDGVIVYRAGFGKGTNEEWISVFEILARRAPRT